jgi:hypothetical protein
MVSSASVTGSQTGFEISKLNTSKRISNELKTPSNWFWNQQCRTFNQATNMPKEQL